MSTKLWTFFWLRFAVVGLVVFVPVYFSVIVEPKLYQATAVFEPMELYAGEDVSFGDLPECVTVKRLAPSDLIEISAIHDSPAEAERIIDELIDERIVARSIAARKKFFADQYGLVSDDAEWRRLELARKLPAVVGITHTNVKIPSAPISPVIESHLTRSLLIALISALAVAAFLSKRRGRREGNGDAIAPTLIARRFAMLALACCSLAVLTGFLVQSASHPGFVASVTVKMSPASGMSFENQAAAIACDEPIAGAVRELGLRERLHQMTSLDAIGYLREGLEFIEDPVRGTVEIRSTDPEADLASSIPRSIAESYFDRRKSWTVTQARKREDTLQFILETGEPGRVFESELQARLAKTRATAIEPPEFGHILESQDARGAPKELLTWFARDSWKEILRGLLYAALATIVWHLDWRGRLARRNGDRAAAVDDFSDGELSIPVDPY